MIRSSSHGIVLYRSHPRALPYLYELSGRGCNTESPMLHCPAERGMTAKVIVAWGKCPLYLQKRTSLSAVVMSALCHVWTAPGWQEESSRSRLGRCSHVFGL